MPKKTLTDEEITSVAELGSVLRDIHERLARDGYFVDGRKRWNIFKCAVPVFEIVIEPEN